jgi:hypothetical protein
VRRRWVQINGELVEITDDSSTKGHEIMTEIKPYKSMITGEMITSRSQHREHLRRHGYREVDDSSLHKPYQGIPTTSKQRKEELIRVVNSMTHKEFRAAGKRELEQWRWNTRKD